MNKLKIKSAEDGFLLSTVRIETDKGTGTGFIVNYDKHDELKTGYFLVTNKHVIEGCSLLKLKFHSIDSFEVGSKSVDLNKHDEFELKENLNDLFHFHPDPNVDIAILSLNSAIFSQKVPLFAPISLSKYLVTEEKMEHLSSVENITFIGYPSGLMDETNLLPITRKGITATPYHFDFKSSPTFLIDASVFPGSSGSPVFLIDNRKDFRMTPARTHLLGIISSVIVRNEKFELKSVEIPVSKTNVFASGQQMIDLGVVFKASEIEKLIVHYYYQTFVVNIFSNIETMISEELKEKISVMSPDKTEKERLEGLLNEVSEGLQKVDTELDFEKSDEMMAAVLEIVKARQ